MKIASVPGGPVDREQAQRRMAEGSQKILESLGITDLSTDAEDVDAAKKVIHGAQEVDPTIDVLRPPTPPGQPHALHHTFTVTYDDEESRERRNRAIPAILKGHGLKVLAIENVGHDRAMITVASAHPKFFGPAQMARIVRSITGRRTSTYKLTRNAAARRRRAKTFTHR
jgi:hypothetical protein